MIITDPHSRNSYVADGIGRTKPLIKIGGNDQKQFLPNMNMSYWCESTDEKYWFNINKFDWPATQEAFGQDLSVSSGVQKMIWDTPDGDNVRWMHEFTAKPIVPTLEWTLKCHPALSFHQQPLTFSAEMLANDAHYTNPAMAGGYVVKCDKRGVFLNPQGETIVSFTTGKLCNIPRPRLTDTDGKEAWCDLLIQVENGIGTVLVTMPTDFLDSARYPIRRNLTFGQTDSGAAVISRENYISGVKATGAAGTGSKISLDCYESGSSGDHNWKCAVYLQADDSFITNSDTQERSDIGTSQAFHDFTFGTAPTFSAVAYYIVGWANNGSGFAYFAYDTVSSAGMIDSQTYGAWPDPCSPTARNEEYSLYVTYTAGGGGNAPTGNINGPLSGPLAGPV